LILKSVLLTYLCGLKGETAITAWKEPVLQLMLK
jgi:hypothetical protein